MSKETLKMALNAFESIFSSTYPYREDGTSTINNESVELSNKAIAAIEKELTQQQSTWVGLNDTMKLLFIKNAPNWSVLQLIEEIEQSLKEKNNG